MAAMEINKLFVGNAWFRKESGWRWSWVALNEKIKNEADYERDRLCLIYALRILKNVAVLFFNTGSDHRMCGQEYL